MALTFQPRSLTRTTAPNPGGCYPASGRRPRRRSSLPRSRSAAEVDDGRPAADAVEPVVAMAGWPTAAGPHPQGFTVPLRGIRLCPRLTDWPSLPPGEEI